MAAERDITNGDLWAAIRGLGMRDMSDTQLLKLAADHDPLQTVGRDAFASRVICIAARELLASRNVKLCHERAEP